MPAPILVTGAAGFIGRQVVTSLAARGVPVRAFDLQPTIGGSNIEPITGTVQNGRLIRDAIEGVQAVVHLAYRIDIDGDDATASLNTNIKGTAAIFEAARRAQVRRVVWASSVMTYGPPGLQAPGPVAEDGVQAPATFYGSGKLFLEKLAGTYRRDGLETVGLRLTTVFGPGRDRGGAAPFAVELFALPSRGEPMVIREGDRRLNFIYGPDAAGACVLAVTKQTALRPIYNIGGFTTSVRDLASDVLHYIPGAKITVVAGGANPWPEEICCLAAERDFAWHPRFDRRGAVSDYLAHLSGNLPVRGQDALSPEEMNHAG
jgi:nucleoside-diphosphate-sugar epimerase